MINHRREWRGLVLGCVASLVLASTSDAQEPKAAGGQDSPRAVAQSSFDALKALDASQIVALTHPEAQERFRTFAVELFDIEEADPGLEQLRALFAPFDSKDKVAAAPAPELMQAFVKNQLAAIPDLRELLADARLEVLGEIEEGPGKVHVITRTVLPRPSPLTCQELDGRWYQMLNEDQMRLLTIFERVKDQLKAKDPEGPPAPTDATLASLEVLGTVPDGEDLAHALCRAETKLGDVTVPVFACYPVQKGEPAWEVRDDLAKLAEALREKFAP